MSIASVILSNHLILCRPLLLLPSIFPNIRVLSNELSLHIRCSKYWSSNISLPNEYSGLISLRIDWFDCSPRGSQESSLAQFEKIVSLALSLLYGPVLIYAHNYLKNCSFDYTDLCQQSNVSAF